MVVDAHQHFWNPGRIPQPWMSDAHSVIARPFEPEDLAPLLAAAGVTRTIVVQGASSDADTDYVFELADGADFVAAVVAWAPLDDPVRFAERLAELRRRPKLRGIRNLIHQEDDRHWIMQPPVLESLAELEAHGLVLELPVEYPRHLEDVPALASRFPRLPIVVDHLGKPPLGTAAMLGWEAELRAAAAHSNVYAKISGLNTVLPPGAWSARDLAPAVEVAVDSFGPERLLLGSDWPVALLNGTYEHVWSETRRAAEAAAPYDVDVMLSATPRRLYGLS